MFENTARQPPLRTRGKPENDSKMLPDLNPRPEPLEKVSTLRDPFVPPARAIQLPPNKNWKVVRPPAGKFAPIDPTIVASAQAIFEHNADTVKNWQNNSLAERSTAEERDILTTDVRKLLGLSAIEPLELEIIHASNGFIVTATTPSTTDDRTKLFSFTLDRDCKVVGAVQSERNRANPQPNAVDTLAQSLTNITMANFNTLGNRKPISDDARREIVEYLKIALNIPKEVPLTMKKRPEDDGVRIDLLAGRDTVLQYSVSWRNVPGYDSTSTTAPNGVTDPAPTTKVHALNGRYSRYNSTRVQFPTNLWLNNISEGELKNYGIEFSNQQSSILFWKGAAQTFPVLDWVKEINVSRDNKSGQLLIELKGSWDKADRQRQLFVVGPDGEHQLTSTIDHAI